MTDKPEKVYKGRGKPFAKGKDPRRHLAHGPRKTFQAMRTLAQSIANEEIVIDPITGATITRGEQILRAWAISENPILAKEFMTLAFGKAPDSPVEEPKPVKSPVESIPADLIARDFLEVYRDIKAGINTEYVLSGGRGSTKSSFISLVFIYLLVNNPSLHAMALRQVANTLRDSVYSQLIWAISVLGITDLFKMTITPMQIEYIPTGQIIYFRGADDPSKLKSIKPPFGYIGLVWFEELDGFYGPEAVRKIEQSVIRGGDKAWTFKSFNPPRTSNNWANKYVLIKKEKQYQHSSNYLNVPSEWLGEPWLAEAEHLAKVNPGAYEHEYLGKPNFAGGMVFGNVIVRKITAEEIKQFDRVLNGLDFGFYPDPADYIKCHYDAGRHKLYIFGEIRKYKTSNEELYRILKTEGGYEDWETLICDSAEPKSVADFRSYGATARGAEKGKESVRYSMKWLQSLAEIVIDNEKAPYAAKEFIEYEFERTKEDEVISAYPDHDNHSIDGTRYATNLIWKRRGQ
jgi:phage terminase large subunit